LPRVVAQDAFAIDDQDKAVLIAMSAAWNSLWHRPDEFLDGNLSKDQLSIPNATRFHPIAL